MLLPSLPVLHGERVGVRGCLHELSARRVPLTRIASDDAIRPLPACGARRTEIAARFFISTRTVIPGPAPARTRNLDIQVLLPPLPVLHGERVGVRGCLHELSARRVPLTRIASFDAIRPLPACGARRTEIAARLSVSTHVVIPGRLEEANPESRDFGFARSASAPV